MGSATGDASARQRGLGAYAADLLRRVAELRHLDRLRHQVPPSSPEFDEVARRIEQKSREVWEVVNAPPDEPTSEGRTGIRR